MKLKVIIDPMVDVYYASFYIRGLYGLFDKSNIVFDSGPFKQNVRRNHNFNFIISKDYKETKYSISLDDSYEIKKECYDWCDKYGCVNVNWKKTPSEFTDKLVSLAPSFGIRLWGIKETIFYALSNYLKLSEKVNIKKFAGKYKRQYILRLPFKRYIRERPIDNYIFHVSTLWQSDKWIRNDDFVNSKRAAFMEVCKSIPEIQFEGGFYYKRNFLLNNDFKHLVIKDFVPVNTYLEKIRQSVLVFNTPAWLNCNGWKLGEYLALGKAIISTPLINDLPEPLVHGENVHFVSDDLKDLKDAVLHINKDKNYRQKISDGAYQYYLRNVTPAKSLELMGITDNCFLNSM